MLVPRLFGDGERPPQELDAAGLRVLAEVHFFAWCFVPRASRRPSAARGALEASDLLGRDVLCSRAVSEPSRSGGPWRVYGLSPDGRVRPARGTLEALDPQPPPSGLEAVVMRGLVPSGGNPLVPAWGSSAVMSLSPVWLRDWGSGGRGGVDSVGWSWVGVGATNLRREDLWRHDVHEHADRVPLPSPFEPASVSHSIRLHTSDEWPPGDPASGRGAAFSTWAART